MPTIRASSLPEYQDCSRMAAAKMFRKDIEDAGFELRSKRNNIGGALGNAFHAGAAHILKTKMEKGYVAGVPEALEIATQEFALKAEEGIFYDDTTPGYAVAVTQIERQLKVWLPLAAEIVPAKVEFELKAADGPFEILGHPDVFTEDSWLRDHKSGFRSRQHHAQVGLYILLARSHGLDVQGVAIDWIKRTPRTKEQADPVTTVYDVNECERAALATLSRVKSDYLEFKSTGDPWSFLANPESMTCGSKWCPAWGTEFCHVGKPESGDK